jgi:hypothetical protein
VLSLKPSIKGIRQLQRALGAESAAQKRALNAAIKVEGFNRLRELRDQIVRGIPGGHPYAAQLSEIARRTRRGRLRKNQMPLYRLARILRYQVEMKNGDLQLSFGFVSQGPRKISGSWKRLLLKHHEGVSVLYGKSRTQLGIELANIGARLEKQGDPDARFFFLRRATGRNIRLPKRPTVDPFYQAKRQPMLESIRANYRRKLAGERI